MLSESQSANLTPAYYTLPTTAALDGLVKGLRAANIEVRDEADGVYLHDPAGNGIRLIA